MDHELDSMLTPVKVNPEDSAAREALATYLTRRNLHHDAEPNLGDPTFQGLLAAAKAAQGDSLPHAIFADYLEENDLHHGDGTLLRMREATGRDRPSPAAGRRQSHRHEAGADLEIDHHARSRSRRFHHVDPERYRPVGRIRRRVNEGRGGSRSSRRPPVSPGVSFPVRRLRGQRPRRVGETPARRSPRSEPSPRPRHPRPPARGVIFSFFRGCMSRTGGVPRR